VKGRAPASASRHYHPRAAAVSTNSRGGKALLAIPPGYVRCPTCRNKCRLNPNKPNRLRGHRDMFGHKCYQLELEPGLEVAQDRAVERRGLGSPNDRRRPALPPSAGAVGPYVRLGPCEPRSEA